MANNLLHPDVAKMAELDKIIEKLRQQRGELDVAIGDVTHAGRTGEILRKLEELRRRSDAVSQLKEGEEERRGRGGR